MKAVALILLLTACVRTPHDRAVAACIRHADGAPARVAECQGARP